MPEPVIPVVPVRRAGPAAWLYRMKDWVEAQAEDQKALRETLEKIASALKDRG